MANHWTDERTAELKRLVAAQFSASEIAKEMGGDLTRNSIIGKCHRLGLTIGKTRQPPAPKPLKPSKSARLFVGSWGACPEIITGHVPPTPEVELPPLNIAFADIRAFQCRWITQEQPVLFCGHPTGFGSWCAAHRAVVFTPRTEKRTSRKLEYAA